DGRMGGRYVPAQSTGTGDVVVNESNAGARRRSVYLQQRRTNVVGVLEVFDAPSLVTNCTRRNATTIPLQSLSLLNSEFVRNRAEHLADRLLRDGSNEDDSDRVESLFLLAYGRNGRPEELDAARRFLVAQPQQYSGRP